MLVLKTLQLSREAAADVHHRGRSQHEPPEIHAAIKHLQQALLLHDPQMKDKPNLSALAEFLLHGVKYALPAVHSEVTRGLLTLFACAPLTKENAPSDELPPVCRWRDGETHGIALEPLYMTAPAAALRDQVFHQPLTLVGRNQGWVGEGAENGGETRSK